MELNATQFWGKSECVPFIRFVRRIRAQRKRALPRSWHALPGRTRRRIKPKEISYIHAEAYPAGELKHGPPALVTEAMPVVTIAPNDSLIEKLKSNLHEVRALGGELFVFADADSPLRQGVLRGAVQSMMAILRHQVFATPAWCGAPSDRQANAYTLALPGRRRACGLQDCGVRCHQRASTPDARLNCS